MLRTFLVLFISTFAIPPSVSLASVITETFSGNSSVGFQDISTTQNMSTNVSVFTKTVTDVVGSAVFTYDINVIASSGDVYSQNNRGLGDTGGAMGGENQFTNADGVFNFKITNLTASLSPNAAPGSSIDSMHMDVEFTSFDVVNNGTYAPTITWTDDGSTPSTSTSSPTMVAGGNSSGFITQVNTVTQHTQDLKIDNVGAGWSWINNVQVLHRGCIFVDVVDPVPEPNSICFLGLAAINLLLRRRRKACI